ncbi:uncharacterized protein AB675_6344 [Cyphellophora attinorum]|uniref:Uncharacterized protein n=1 Tax=Cyphellophora attinorum TaxID=1664694 RepID=A0A0N1HEM2_9EURO|nr:uncharacterized protein AB675_6344 [Phialophora attinorum]KPI43920.1 hypothetical protein AB675_6344 [Phialophora attinorum]
MALQIHDAELSMLLHRRPLLRHSTSEKSQQQSLLSFEANTASKWVSAHRQHVEHDTLAPDSNNHFYQDNTIRNNLFRAYATLEGLGAMMMDDRLHNRLDQAAFSAHQQCLLDWYKLHASSILDQHSDYLCLRGLWHGTYLYLLADVDQLEVAIGRDGPEAARDATAAVTKWAATTAALRSMLHVLSAQRYFQSVPFKNIPAIHGPRILFTAAVAWYCFTKYSHVRDMSVDMSEASLPELKAFGSNIDHFRHVLGTSMSPHATPATQTMTLCDFGTLLRRMPEWGLAGKFAAIVARLVDGDASDCRPSTPELHD